MVADGRLYAAQQARRRIVVYGPGTSETTLAESVQAGGLAITADGVLYFSNPKMRTIGMISVKGGGHPAYSGSEIGEPAGLALSPDQAMLIATDAQGRFSWSFQITADGSLANGEPFYRLELPESGFTREVRGAAEDTIGQVTSPRRSACRCARPTAAWR